MGLGSITMDQKQAFFDEIIWLQKTAKKLVQERKLSLDGLRYWNGVINEAEDDVVMERFGDALKRMMPVAFHFGQFVQG